MKLRLRKPMGTYDRKQNSNKFGITTSWQSYKGKGSLYGGSAGKMAAVAARQAARISGKGRYGKRPPSLIAAEHAAPAIDSEDSGFECEYQSSESQPSWSHDEAVHLGATTNSTSAIQQPIFSLRSRALSNSNLSTSSHISTLSPSSSTGSSFAIPSFSSSTPAEKQFLTTLLHESLAQEDHAIDPFDVPYYSTTTAVSPTSSFSSVASPPTLVSSPENPVSSGKLLLIVPGPTVAGVNTNQPLDFAQVFGKLTTSTTPTAATIFNSALANELSLMQAKTAIQSIAAATEGRRQEQAVEQQLACDSRVIKIDQGIHTRNINLSPEIQTDIDTRSNDVVTFPPTYSMKSETLSENAIGVGSHNSCDSTSTSSVLTAPGAYSKLKDILIESSRDALEGSTHNRVHGSVCNDESISAAVTTTAASQVSAVDPMVILSQAVNLQKELYDEPALDGIPISVKNTNINGFGFSKGITATTTTAPTAVSVKGLVPVVNSQLATSSAATLVTDLSQHTHNQSVLDSTQQPMKLMQLTDRMAPDNSDRSVTAPNAVPFSALQVTSAPISIPTANQMGVNSTPHNTTAVTSSPIPMKRSRFSFPHPAASKGTGLKLRNQNLNQNYMPARSVGKRLPPGTTPTLASNLAPYTRDGRAQLQIVSQPEEQHRARYQTEGSRGAIKDRKGNGFPTVKLVGYDKPATLQIFIGTDQGKVSPHMFYQACKVTGKSSTPCIEKKVEGTILIEIEFEPSKEMVISCDCVGILKERNVDVEQRFPFHHASQSRKKSTKCRMIYRTTVMNNDGMEETLQVASLPILCTQPPGVPEICKQSLTECPAKGGLELFVIGKNFLKDTRVIFQQEDNDGQVIWEASSEPLKDYLQQNHLICAVPPFKEEKTIEPVECKVLVVSGGKQSEPHRFTYLPELTTVHLGIPPSLSSCVPNSQNPQQSQVQAPPSVIQSALVQQISGGQALLSVDLQSVNVSPMIQPRENILVKSVISSPSDACSPMSITSPGGSLCSSGSQPSPPATAINGSTQGLSPLSANFSASSNPLGFSAASLIQTPVTSADNPSVVVSNFQAVLQQAVQQQQAQQVETKPVVELMKTASELMESMNKPPVTSAFTSLTLQAEKPVVSNAIPLDLQFPTQDLPTTEAATLAAPVANPFQSNQQQLNCVNIPQIINGMAMNGTISTTATSPPVISAAATVSDVQQQNTVPTTSNDIIIATGTTGSTPVTVPTLTVADCLGQAIIKAEPTSVISNDLRLAMSNTNVVNVTPVSATPLANGGTPQGIGLLGGGEMQAQHGSFANALSQMSDNELINYINPNCFEGAIL